MAQTENKEGQSKMATWIDFVKQAQSFGYWAPAHDANENRQYNEGARNTVGRVAKFTRDVDDAIVGGVGSVVGGVMGASMGAYEANKAHGWSALTDWGRFKDYMKMIGQGAAAGAKTGWKERNRLTHDIKTTAATTANDLGLLPDSSLASMRQTNNAKLLDSMRNHGVDVPENPPVDPGTGELLPTGSSGYEDYDRYVSSSNYGKLWGREFLDSAVFAAVPSGYRKLPAMSGTAKILQRGYNGGGGQADAQAVQEFKAFAEAMKESDPSSEEYRKIYEAMRQNRHLDPKLFSELAPPAQASSVQDPDAEVQADNAAPRSENRWSMSPELQNMLGYGLGGALLGGVLGGKGSWWKWGLLSLLLGALHQRNGLGNAWNNVKELWKSK